MVTKEQRSKAKNIYPSMRIGKSGITDSLVKELRLQIKNKKLVKVKFLKSFIENKDKKHIARELAERTGSELVQQIGNVVVLAKKRK